jgi:hypothetical protein
LSGGTPFDPINIEDAYDLLLRLVRKDEDILSDFVQSWDPVLDFMKPRFSEERFMKGIIESLHDQSRSLSHGIIQFDQNALREAADSISSAFGTTRQSRTSDVDVSDIYIDILVKILSEPCQPIDYMDSAVEFSRQHNATVATLNYDILFEEAALKKGTAVDYGLQDWKNRQVVRWDGSGVKLAKLHGSINWRGTPESFEVSAPVPQPNRWTRTKALMIFGGQANKLTPHGPFLQLRHQFESALMKSNVLVVAGYSFSDIHINSILSRWISTRGAAKMVILEPGDVPFERPLFRGSYSHNGEEKRKTVELVHVKKSARNGFRDAVHAAGRKIDTRYGSERNGYLPRILVQTIS